MKLYCLTLSNLYSIIMFANHWTSIRNIGLVFAERKTQWTVCLHQWRCTPWEPFTKAKGIRTLLKKDLVFEQVTLHNMGTFSLITMTSQWVGWRLKLPASRLFTQPFIRAQIKENIKAPRHWPLCGEYTGDRWWRHHVKLQTSYFDRHRYIVTCYLFVAHCPDSSPIHYIVALAYLIIDNLQLLWKPILETNKTTLASGQNYTEI